MSSHHGERWTEVPPSRTANALHGRFHWSDVVIHTVCPHSKWHSGITTGNSQKLVDGTSCAALVPTLIFVSARRGHGNRTHRQGACSQPVGSAQRIRFARDSFSSEAGGSSSRSQFFSPRFLRVFRCARPYRAVGVPLRPGKSPPEPAFALRVFLTCLPQRQADPLGRPAAALMPRHWRLWHCVFLT